MGADSIHPSATTADPLAYPKAALSSPLSPHATLVTPPPGSTQTGPQGYYGAPLDSGAYAAHGQPSFADEDVIPTAIVVKNIPFSVKKEQLLQIIEELRIPMPYAFNYHFDQGIFRGLAFANFRSSEEADAVVAALNGFDVAGRKLRVEYKKVLQVGEKERIEKEKALKRMRSMQMEKDRVRRETDPSAVPPLPSPSTALPPGSALGVDTYGAGSTSGGDPYGNGLQQQPDRLSPPISRSPGPADRASPTSASDAPPSSSGKREELDLNDPQALEIYSRVLLFKDDRMRDELAFSRNLSPQERRTVHLVAQKLNLYHYSVGEAEERHVIVTKNEVRSPSAGSRPLRSQASTIGRSQRAGDQAAAAAAAAAGGGIGGSGAGTFASINRRSSGMLRGKKSAPDIKRNRGEMQYDISTMPSGGYGSAAHFSTANGLTQSLGRKSNGNLREGYGSTSAMGSSAKGRTAGGGGGIGGAAGLQSLFASPFEVPPVPSLGTSYGPESTGYSTSVGGNGGSTISAGANGALRQPRGPPTPGQSTESRNFAPRINRMAANAAAAAGSSSQGSTEGSSDKVGSSDVRPQYGADMEGRLASIDVQSREPLE